MRAALMLVGVLIVGPESGNRAIADEPRLELNSVELRRALAQLPRRPSLGEVQRGALQRAQLDPRRTARWLKRVRAAAALPRLEAGYDYQLDGGWQLDREAGEADQLRSDVGQGRQLRVRVVWQLDRLIFHPDELRAARAALDFADWRQRVVIEVTRLYFERQRLLLERLTTHASEHGALADRELRILEIEGTLSALCGVKFSPSIW